MTFLSLTHARAVRDRLAKEAIEDGALEVAIEEACRAEGDYRAVLQRCAVDIFEGHPPDHLQSMVATTSGDTNEAALEAAKRVIDAFCAEVNTRAEMNMIKTGKLEGSHYAAMRQVREELSRP